MQNLINIIKRTNQMLMLTRHLYTTYTHRTYYVKRRGKIPKVDNSTLAKTESQIGAFLSYLRKTRVAGALQTSE